MFERHRTSHLSHWLRRSPTLKQYAVAIAAVMFASASGLASAATYYVDAVSGSDTAAGTSTTTAWKTLAKVNATTFRAGDSILFQSGQRWVGQLHPRGSGVSGNPITLSSYGSGAMPVIDGQSLASGGAIYLSNQKWWTIDGFEVTNDSGVNNLGTPQAGSHRSGIFVDNNGGGTLGGITIRNNYVHDVNGCFVCNGAAPHNNGGIVVAADLMNLLSFGSGSYNGVLIENNRVERVGRTGIIFNDWSIGLLYTIFQSSLSKNVAVLGNTVHTADSDGIIVAGSQDNLIAHNIVGDAGLKTVAGTSVPSAAGIWTAKSINTTIEYNEVYGVRTQQNVDGQGFDADLVASNVTVQYNYSHDNEGGFMLMQGGPLAGSGLVVRYNLSVNDGWGGSKGIFTFALGLIQNTSIYNNTIYVAGGLPSKIMYCDGWDGVIYNQRKVNFHNNVIANFGSGIYNAPSGTTAKTSHNLFFGNHPTSEPADAYKLIVDPQMIAPSVVAPEGLDAVAGYGLMPSSPALGSGVLINANGEHDFFGNAVSQAALPTRGFHEAN
jgi:hypothetical protein